VERMRRRILLTTRHRQGHRLVQLTTAAFVHNQI
jgi:hypothetical protein